MSCTRRQKIQLDLQDNSSTLGQQTKILESNEISKYLTSNFSNFYENVISFKTSNFVNFIIVYYVPRRTMRVIAWRAAMLAGDRSRGAISPASIVASLVIFRIVCIGTYSILCDFGADTSFYALDISRLVPAISIFSILCSNSVL